MNTIKTLTVRLEDDLHKEFKIYSAKKGIDMSTILIEYIKKLLDQSSNDLKQK